jgi:hypothetical protein
MEIHRAKLFNNAVLHSLNTIQSAKSQFHLSTSSNMTANELVSQIGLCDVLLREIRVVRRNLEGRMRRRVMIHRHSLLAKRIRSSMHPAIPHDIHRSFAKRR